MKFGQRTFISLRGAILNLVLIAFVIAVLPPGYGALVERAYEEDEISQEKYDLAYKVRWFLERPGRLLLTPTIYDGALISPHVPFWTGLLVLIVANWSLWFLIIGLLCFISHKILLRSLQAGGRIKKNQK